MKWLRVSWVRSAAAVLCCLLLSVGCGGGALTLTEYVDRINEIEAMATRRAREIADSAAEITDLTPQDIQSGLERATAIRLDVKEAADKLEPPAQIADLHHLIFDWHTRFIEVETALAVRAGDADDTVADWTALSASDEMAAYREAIADGKAICLEFQIKLDATAARGVFADTPWIPGQMAEVVEAVLGCSWFPENPEDVYRYPPSS